MAHTPGPWTFDQHFRDYRGADGHFLDDHTYRADGEVIANRHLQVAAPDLLAAAEAIVSAFVSGSFMVRPHLSDRAYERANDAAKALDAAIAKAKGEATS